MLYLVVSDIRYCTCFLVYLLGPIDIGIWHSDCDCPEVRELFAYMTDWQFVMNHKGFVTDCFICVIRQSYRGTQNVLDKSWNTSFWKVSTQWCIKKIKKNKKCSRQSQLLYVFPFEHTDRELYVPFHSRNNESQIHSAIKLYWQLSSFDDCENCF